MYERPIKTVAEGGKGGRFAGFEEWIAREDLRVDEAAESGTVRWEVGNEAFRRPNIDDMLDFLGGALSA